MAPQKQPCPVRRQSLSSALATGGLLLAVLACLAPLAAAYTRPDQFQIISEFRDAMLARPGQRNWGRALASWICPTDPSNSVGSGCDPCGQQVWGNWKHLACRGERVSLTKFQVPGNGLITNVHITDHFIEGEVPLAELCHLTSLTEFDLDGGVLTGAIPVGFADCYPELLEIDLSYNRLTGTLPPEIAEVRTLEEFKVEVNQLTGTLPAEYALMPNMNWLRFSDNKLNGTIPESFAITAPHLGQLTLHNNNFEGNLYPLADHLMVNFNAAENPSMCGMVPVGLRFAHGFNYYRTNLGLPCPEELEAGWVDLSEVL